MPRKAATGGSHSKGPLESRVLESTGLASVPSPTEVPSLGKPFTFSKHPCLYLKNGDHTPDLLFSARMVAHSFIQ